MKDDSIVLSYVEKHFPSSGDSTQVLHDVNFRIPRGSFTILFGPSGSGKTTLVNMIAGLLEPTSGTVSIDGQDIYQLNSQGRTLFRARHMGIFHQTNYWMRSLSVLENVAMPLYLLGRTRLDAQAVARESLQHVGMEAYADQSPFHLSGGQQQQVSLARALVANAEIILADEPTGNLDSKSGQRVMELLAHAHEDFGCTVVLITHNLEYLKYGTKHLFINDGMVSEPKPGQPLPPAVKESLETQIQTLTAMEKGHHAKK